MSAEILSTAERFRRYQRDLTAYRRRSLFRRSHARFHRDLHVLPYLFLSPKVARAAALRQPRERLLEELRGRIVWTLDTASRLACGIGFLAAQDLTGYPSEEADVLRAVDQGLIEEPRPASLSLDPAFERPPFLVLRTEQDPPPSWVLPSGHHVVTWERLMRDLQGTLGWRPDLLTRLEDAYVRQERPYCEERRSAID